jgi:hypothetical protein
MALLSHGKEYPEGIFTYLELIFGVKGANDEFLAYKVEFYTGKKLSFSQPDFLNDAVRDLVIGENGRAYIVDSEGIVVALSKSENQMTTDSEGNRTPRNIDSLGEIDEGIKLILDSDLLATKGAVTKSGKAESGTELTVSKTPGTALYILSNSDRYPC